MNGITETGVVPVQELESLRIRVTQLHHSLSHMLAQLQQPKLAPWPSLQGQFNVLLTQLAALSSVINSCADTMSKCVIYPLPNFPTTTQVGLLSTLLRKKNLPQVEEWIEDGEDAGKDINISQDAEFCKWALQITQTARENHLWHGFDTKDGLPEEEETQDQKKELQRENQSDEDIEMTDVVETPKQGWTLDQTIAFMSKGVRP